MIHTASPGALSTGGFAIFNALLYIKKRGSNIANPYF